jgi:pyruvyltransferase
MITKDCVYAYWCLSPNFGDALTPYLIEKISGKQVVFSPAYSDVTKVLVTGSVLNHEVVNAVAWGVGLANRMDSVSIEKLLAVRGYLSLLVCIQNNKLVKNTVIGDPSLLLPNFYKPSKEKRYKIGILPHYVDLEVVLFKENLPKDCIIINVLDPVEKVVAEICSCEKIVSSSLHGLIVSDAYKIPNLWVEFSKGRILGDRFKYYDYYSTTKAGINVAYKEFSEDLFFDDSNFKVNQTILDLNKLYACCPFK